MPAPATATAPPSREDRWPAAVILVGLAALVLYALRDLLLAGDAPLPGRDSVNLYAWEIYTRSVLGAGRLPFWNAFHYAGTPHLADTQTTVLYPVALLLRWLPPEAFLSWMAAIHIWLAGTGTLFLARAVGLGWLPATAAAIAGMLGGSVGARLHNGHLLLLYCTAWFPWALALAIVSVRRERVSPHPGLVLVLVLQFLAGYLQGSVYLVGVVCLYYVYSAIWPDARESRPARNRVLRQLLVVGILSLGVAAFQLFPLARLVSEAARWQGIPYEEAAEGGWTLHSLVTLLFPFAEVSSVPPHRDIGDASTYVGLLLTILVPVALLDRQRRRFVAFFGALTILSLAIVTIDLPFYRLHHALFPGFRYPVRLLLVATTGLAVVGAVGLNQFVTLALTRRWRLLTIGLVPSAFGFAAALLVMLSSADRPPLPAPSWPWLPAVAVASLVLVAALAARARTQVALVVGLLVVAIDMAAFTAGAAATVYVEPLDRVREVMGAPISGRAISTCEQRIGAGEMLRNGTAGLDGLAGIVLGHYSDWAHVMTSGNPLPNDGQFHGIDSEGGLPARRDLLDAANTTVVFSCAPLDAPAFTLMSRVEGIHTYRNDSAQPRGFWTCGGLMTTREIAVARTLGSRYDTKGRLQSRAYVNVRWAAEIDVERQRTLEQRYSLADGVVIDERTWRYTLTNPAVDNIVALIQDAAVEDTHGVDRGTGAILQASSGATDDIAPAGDEMIVGTTPCEGTAFFEIQVQDQLDGHLEATVNAPVDGYLFLSEPYYSERRAFVDGRAVSPVKANLAFTAVPVPAGDHRVELRYVPESFCAGLAVSVLTLAGWGGWSWKTSQLRAAWRSNRHR